MSCQEAEEKRKAHRSRSSYFVMSSSKYVENQPAFLMYGRVVKYMVLNIGSIILNLAEVNIYISVEVIAKMKRVDLNGGIRNDIKVIMVEDILNVVIFAPDHNHNENTKFILDGEPHV